MDAIAFENEHYAYVIQDVRYGENCMAEESDELSISVDPLTGEAHFDYDPRASANLKYEQFWDHATAAVSGRYGVILGESVTTEGIRYFSIALGRGSNGKTRTIHVYVSKPDAQEAPAPGEGDFSGTGH